MFDFDKSAQDIDLSSQNNLCVALDRHNKCEILVCTLPTTLQQKSGNNDVKFDRHLSFNHGYFTDSPLVQVSIFTVFVSRLVYCSSLTSLLFTDEMPTR